MGALRQLSAIFLVTASAFTIAIAMQDHPVLKMDTQEAARLTWEQSVQAAVALNDDVIQPGWKFARAESVVLEQKIASEFSSPPKEVARAQPAGAIPHPIPRPRVAELAAPAPAKHPQVATVQAPPATPAPTETRPAPALRPSVPETMPEPQVALASPPKRMELAPQATVPAAAPAPKAWRWARRSPPSSAPLRSRSRKSFRRQRFPVRSRDPKCAWPKSCRRRRLCKSRRRKSRCCRRLHR